MAENDDTPRTALRAIREWTGVFRLASWMALVSVPVLFALTGWFGNKVIDASEVNRVQDSRIDTVEKRAAEDREEQRRMAQQMTTILERIADRVGAAK